MLLVIEDDGLHPATFSFANAILELAQKVIEKSDFSPS